MRSQPCRGPLPHARHRALIHLIPVALALTLAHAASPPLLHAEGPPGATAPAGGLTGRVQGDDHRPIELAEIRIPALKRGTRSDALGRFRFEGLPPGEYLVEASLLGHAPVVGKVQIRLGETSVLELQLGEERAVKTVAPIVVQGKRNEVRPEQIGPRYKTDREKITDYRPSSITEIAGQAAGVVNTGNEIHVRGGRGNELKVLIGGVEAFDVLGSRNAQVAVGAVSSVELVSGGVNPEHGNALSGVLDVVTREGGEEFEGDVRWDTDRYGDPTKTFDRYDRLSLAMGGPLALHGLSWFATYEGTFQDGYLRSNQTHASRTVLDFIQLGDRQDDRVNTQWKLAWGPNPVHHLTLEGIANHARSTPYVHSWSRKGYVQMFHDSGAAVPRYGSWSSTALDSSYAPMNLADHVPTQDDRFRQLLLAYRFVPNKSWVFNSRLASTAFDTHQGVGDREPWEYDTQSPFFWNGNLTTGTEGNPYFATHGDFPTYADAHSRAWTWKSDVSTERWRQHRLKTGLDLQWHSVQNVGLTFPNGESGGLPGTVRSDYANAYPQGGAFLHDLWRFEGLVLSTGLRLDVFSPGQQVAMSDLPSGKRFKHQISPRLGVSYPVSDRDALSFHYGWTFQTVSSAALFENRGIASSVGTKGNPDLEPETDVSYQAALQHLFAKDLYGQFSVFFRDIYGLLTVRADRDEAGNQISVWENGDYASARGFEMSLARSFSHHFSADAAYTYSVATGVASDPAQAQQFVNGGTLYLPISERALRWDQRHTLSLQSTIRYPGQWGMHVQWSYGSGLPFTPRFRNDRRSDPKLENSRRLPTASRLSLSGDRYVRIWGQDLTLFADARNLLDARNVAGLSWGDGINPNVNLAGGDDYAIYYTETGRVGGAYLKDTNGDHELDWVPLQDPRVHEEGRSVRMGLAMRF
ncbi:MAG: TonB-dependent receptor [Candidatus Eisenbacteria bacterium]|nr:TonB-dependent receptor [Candidatus Eisenbacteria bacterium]